MFDRPVAAFCEAPGSYTKVAGVVGDSVAVAGPAHSLAASDGQTPESADIPFMNESVTVGTPATGMSECVPTGNVFCGSLEVFEVESCVGVGSGAADQAVCGLFGEVFGEVPGCSGCGQLVVWWNDLHIEDRSPALTARR